MSAPNRYVISSAELDALRCGLSADRSNPWVAEAWRVLDEISREPVLERRLTARLLLAEMARNTERTDHD